MASTYSTSLRLELMATGDQSGTWGDTTNTNLGTLLEQAITGVLSVAQGDATLTLTSTDGASDQALVISTDGNLDFFDFSLIISKSGSSNPFFSIFPKQNSTNHK